MHGHGMLVNHEGAKYEGTFRNGLRCVVIVPLCDLSNDTHLRIFLPTLPLHNGTYTFTLSHFSGAARARSSLAICSASPTAVLWVTSTTARGTAPTRAPTARANSGVLVSSSACWGRCTRGNGRPASDTVMYVILCLCSQ